MKKEFGVDTKLEVFSALNRIQLDYVCVKFKLKETRSWEWSKKINRGDWRKTKSHKICILKRMRKVVFLGRCWRELNIIWINTQKCTIFRISTTWIINCIAGSGDGGGRIRAGQGEFYLSKRGKCLTWIQIGRKQKQGWKFVMLLR